jgi:hypothetical protein
MVRGSPLKKFWHYVTPTAAASECWLWGGMKSHWGHGIISDQPRGHIRAHRFAWELFNGPIPEGLIVCHKCDVPSCVNPLHLFVGTPADNSHDMKIKGRAAKPQAKMTPRQVETIRAMAELGYSRENIAAVFGLGYSAVWRIVTGRTWRAR